MMERSFLSFTTVQWPPLLLHFRYADSVICTCPIEYYYYINKSSCLYLEQSNVLLLPILSLLLNQNNQMDSNASGFLLNNSILHSVYYQTKEDNGIIDLGFSLRTLQPEAYHPSRHSCRHRILSEP